MTIGISDWLDMETVPAADVFHNETAPADDDDLDVTDDIDVVSADVDAHSAFAVVTLDETGEETAYYFTSLRAAQVFAAGSDDEVIGFEGLMVGVR